VDSDHTTEVHQQTFFGLPYAWGWKCVCGAEVYDLYTEQQADQGATEHLAEVS
jgi:hypothetical protein